MPARINACFGRVEADGADSTRQGPGPNGGCCVRRLLVLQSSASASGDQSRVAMPGGSPKPAFDIQRQSVPPQQSRQAQCAMLATAYQTYRRASRTFREKNVIQPGTRFGGGQLMVRDASHGGRQCRASHHQRQMRRAAMRSSRRAISITRFSAMGTIATNFPPGP